MRRLIGYLLIAASLVAGVYVVFVLFAQWLGSGSSGQLLLDGLLLIAIFALFCVGYYLITAIER
jgi:hypothetical protein